MQALPFHSFCTERRSRSGNEATRQQQRQQLVEQQEQQEHQTQQQPISASASNTNTRVIARVSYHPVIEGQNTALI